MTNKIASTDISTTKRALLAIQALQSKLEDAERVQHEPIAIIGQGCRFPQADNPEAFWTLLQTATDAITEVPANRWDLESFYDANPDAPGKIYTRYGGFLNQVDQFDPQFFNISLREARSLDPQQRLLLEVSWEALEQANQISEQLFKSATGVFVGISTSDYALRSVKQEDVPIDAYFGTGNALSVAAGRLSYTLGLTGPSMAVDTACSSSLVAVHLACQSLRQGECRMALAGAVNLLLSPENSISTSKARMLSADGRCKTFDAQANGYVRGEGCGVVVLKRLRDAIADGDTILATIRGSAINQDGPSGGLTVPNGPAQQAVIRQALAQAQLDPHQIQYVEAHGTGTALGDPIELQALGAVYGQGRATDAPLIVGSAKTNIGHLEAAAGMVGLIKLVLALQHEEIPAHLHFQQPSPHIAWAELPVTIPTRSIPWTAGQQPRRAGLSSFGFSGTNTHLIVEEAPIVASSQSAEIERPLHVFTLSGKSETALPDLARQYANYLATRSDIDLGDLCLTANAYRSHFKYRLALTAQSSSTLQADLNRIAQGQSPENSVQSDQPIRGAIAFIFTGQGSQYPGMGQQLYQTQPVFRAALTQCAEILAPVLDIPLLSILYPDLYPTEHSPDCIHETRYAQPAIFALEYALAQLWQSWGIRPQAVMGHSLGEYVAACIAGVFSLADGLNLIAHRAKLMQALPPNGSMVAVLADVDTVTQAIAPYADQVSIAAFNGPRNLVISGVAQAIDAVVQTLQNQGIQAKNLAVSHAFHSPLMEPMLEDFRRVAQSIAYTAPNLDLISNLTGRAIGPEIATADYWVHHVRQPVQFTQSLTALLEQGHGIFLELGPKPTLLGMAQRIERAAQPERLWLASLRSEEDNWQTILMSLGQLFARGVEVDWLSFDQPYGRQRLTGLPTYPFQRQRYWFDEGVASVKPSVKPSVQAPLEVPMTMAYTTQYQASDRRSQILAMLQSQVGKNLVGAGAWVDPQATFLELGADSINLLETLQALDTTFGVQISMAQIFTELTTLDALATYLDQVLPDEWELPDAVRVQLAPPLESSQSTPTSDFTGVLTQIDQLQHNLSQPETATPVERVIRDQLSVLQTVMMQQLTVLQSQPTQGSTPTSGAIQRPTGSPAQSNSHGNHGYHANGHSPSNHSSNGHGQEYQPLRSSADRALSLATRPQVNPTSAGSSSLQTLVIPKATSTTDTFPLSVGQQQMWWVETLAGNNVYLIPAAVQIAGVVNLAALEQSFNAVIARHDSLRTTFHVEAGQPVQRIHPARSIQLSVLQRDSEGPAVGEIQSLVRELAAPPFNLETDLLLRAQWVQWQVDEQTPNQNRYSALILVIHHIISDAWSVGVLIQELLALYPQFCAGQAIALPALPIQYPDFAVWQREKMAAELESNLGHWRSKLAYAPILTLPTDAPHPAQPTFRGRTHHQQFAPTLGAALKAFSQQSGVTLFMTLMGAYSILLHRYSGQTDLLIGSTFAARQQPQVQPLIGLLLNTLAFRIDTSGNPTVQELLTHVKQVALDVFAHPEIPFAELSAQLPPEERRASWFQAMFILQTIPRPALSAPNLALTLVPVNGDCAKCDLALWMEDSPAGLRAEWEYNCDLFEATTIERIAAQFNQLLESLVQDAQRPIAQLPLLSPTELRCLEGFASYPSVISQPLQPVHEWIEQHAEQTPMAIALEGGGQIWSYQTLNERANQIAHTLQAQGIREGSLVGVCLERSPDLIATLVGVLKSGATYLPMDPTYPLERLHHMLNDAQVSALVTRAELQTKLQLKAPVVLDITAAAITEQSIVNLHQPVSLDHIAYIIYTSGSTGKPKGTQLTHRGLANFIQQAIVQYGFKPSDRVLQFASISFDAAVEEIYGTLCSGGTLVLRTDEMLASSQVFCDTCAAAQITVWDLPTAFWHRLTQDVAQGNAALPASLQMVIIGGERALSQTVNLWQQVTHQRSIRLLNTYGPTETTVVATFYEITPETEIPLGADVPIGKPLGNVQVYVLDEYLQPVPIGVAGELYIGGDCLAAGYLNRPELTAERFIPHPFKPNERLYKTGDRVRFLATGDLVCLGRTDDQVKIRGFRVELGEVEAVVTQYPGVREAAIVVREDQPGQKVLCAYVVPHAQQTVDSGALRQALRQTLPDYMVPSFIVLLEQLPLSGTGKVDRKALPAPQAEHLGMQDQYEAPRNPTEEALAQLWSELLGIEPIGINSSFFELGGHSLLVMQLLSQIRQAFQMELSLAEVFHTPTIAHLAQLIDQTTQTGSLSFPTIPVVERGEPLPLSLAQQRIWLLEQMETVSAAYHIALRQNIQGQFDIELLNQCLEILVARHEVLRTTFHLAGDRPVQVIHPTLPLRVEYRAVADLPVELSAFAKTYANQPFDLATGPLLRVMLIQVAPNQQTLLLAIHHIISDGWSFGILVQEMMALYPALAQGQSPQLPELSIQAVDFAQWQRQWLQGEVLQQQLDYWHHQLSGAPTVLNLPTDRPRPAEQTFEGAVLRIPLPLALTQAINRFSQQAGVSLYMTLLGAFGVLLQRSSGQSEILVGSPIANRNHPQIQGLMGFFLNTLVLRLNGFNQPNFQDFLHQVQTVALEAYTHQDVPFEQLLEIFPTERNRGYSPWFQVMFILQNAHRHQFELPGIQAEGELLDMGVAKFDITLSMTETESGLMGEWEYNCDLFDAATIERMASQLKHLLEAITQDSQQSIAQLPLIPMSEQTLLEQFTQTGATVSQPLQPVHEWIEQHAEQTPMAIALEGGGQIWSYQTLNERANQIAHTLQAQGITAGSLVGVCLERSPELIATLLGALKAGATYLPMDPTYPLERLHHMLNDAQVNALVTRVDLQTKLQLKAPVVLDIRDEDIAAQSTANLDHSISLDHIAYIIYTSGSTGKPKGTQLTHRGLANFIQQAIAHYGFTPSDRVLQFASISFDAAVEEIYGTLCSGGTLVLRTDEMLASSQVFCDTCAAEQITVWDLPTAFWHRLTQDVAQGNADLPAPLQMVIIGGERALSQTVNLWQQVTHQRSIRLLNTYGPTETTVVATFYEITPETEIPLGADVPIGKPLGNVQAYVLDEYLQPVPIGVAGELYIGGDCLAAGYLNRPELTAERFIPHPFRANERLYKTGDRVRFLATGDLVCLGRTDDQVKIRGFRVELGEVENLLQSHPAVHGCAVIAQTDEQGINQLIAYVVSPGHDQPIPDLRSFLLAQVPDYMVPALFITVAEISLTPAGKVDRRALPTPQAADWVSTAEYVAPRTPTEAALAFIVAEVLKIERVGIRDDFFALGGHSLSAMQVLARIRTMFGKEVSLRALFEEPTVAAIALELEGPQLTNPQEQDTSLTISLADRGQPLALSPAQERLWFLRQLEGDTATYNLPFALRLLGQVDQAAMTHCLNAIVNRHEVLRTTFAQLEDRSVQIIHPDQALTIVVEAIAAVDDSATYLQQRIFQEAQIPFDLKTGPLLRVTLLQVNPTEHVLLVTMHHIISDAWSIGLFVQEVMTLYPSFCNGRSPQISPLPVQYADYAAWQLQHQQTEAFRQRLAAWVQQFSDAPPLLELPTDYPRPAIQSFQGGMVRVELPQALTQTLKTFSQRQHSTLFMTLLAAFVTLLQRYSRQTDLVVGVPTAGRTHPDLETLIGFFINTLPLRFALTENLTFATLLEQVQATALEGFAHQDIPFAKVIEGLTLSRDLSYLPLCQVMFVLQNAPAEALTLPGLTLEPLTTHSGVSRFDMTLSMTEMGDRLIGEWEYNSDLFEENTIVRMAAQFQVLLEGIIANPQQPIGQIPLLAPLERQTLLVDWNQTEREYPPDQAIHQLIAAQVERTPEAIAAQCADRTLTYRVLDEQANQLAHYLQSQGIGVNSLVGLSVERNSWMLIGLLGILKAGAAYVPLDPAFPAERLALMVSDAQLSLVITQAHLAARLPTSDTCVLNIDAQWEAISQHPTTAVPSPVSSSQLAYVIYTSGSTGRPKGVQVTHGNVVNFLSAMQERPGIAATDILLSVTTLSFDIAVLELFLPLSVGATVVVASQEVARDGNLLHQLLVESATTAMQATPATWRMLLDAGWQGNSNLKILSGGEALSPQLAQALSERCGSLWNLYGPTETTVWSLCDRVDWTADNGTITIGTPIANTQVYVLGTDLQPLPIGVPGELLIGGTGVTPGYLNQPELTAERFIPNPFSTDPSQKLYRTGDLVRYRPDGRLDYLGRIDFQVKLRGFRIELGEIEAVLMQHPAVKAAVAIVRQVGADSQMLVAYVVLASPDLSTAELQEQARQFLPHYMVPAAFVMLEALPLTPNGKIDRKALPIPKGEDFQASGEYVAPRTEVETQLAQIWSDLLGLSPIGINDNFFEIGGHSLAAMQLVGRVRQQFQQELSLRSLFEAPTIAAIAAQLAEGTTPESALTLAIPLVDRTQPIPLSFAQQRLWFLSQLEGASATYNMPIALRLQGTLNYAALEQCFAEIVTRHEVLRTNFAQTDGEGIQVIQPHLSIPITVVDLTQEAESSSPALIAHYMQAAAQTCFDLETGALLHVKLLRLSEQEHILLLTIHHIISDAWSLGLFVREIMVLYPAYCSGQVSPLSPLPLQYADYAVWQRQQQQADDFQQRLAAQAQQLMDAPSLLELPTDHPRPAVQSFQGGRVQVELSSTLSAKLNAFSQQQQKTLFMTLLGAFVTLMHRYSGQADLVIGTPIAGRYHPELEALMGFFINTLPLRFTLAEDATYATLLEQVQTMALEAFTHQDIPFEKLLEQLPLERDLSYLPLCQVMFTLQNAPMEVLQIPGLTLEALPTHSGVSRFDLTLSMREVGDRLIGEWEYNSDLFEASTIARMATQFEVLLEAILANPQQSLATLPLLPPSEQYTLLTEWNQTQVERPQQCIHHWFEAQVELTPEAIAISDRDTPLSYRALNERANQLAHYLQSLGAQPDQLIGICLERSIEMIVAMLAVFKAGAAYVPLDPTYPVDRLTHMVNDSQLQVLIVTAELMSRFPQLSPHVHCLHLEAMVSELQSQPQTNPMSAVTPTHLAYVIYTSGSTGLPKGVMVEHKGLGNLAAAQIQAFNITPQSCILQMAPFSFDASVSEILMALCAGARLVLGHYDQLLGQGEILQQQGVTHLTMPPSALSILSLEDLAAVEHLIVAGEACSAELVAQWSQRPGFYNAYGPTEATVCATIANCTETQAKPPIGRPIQNVQVYVVDQHLQPVPVGVPGELLIGGVGLARGYLHRPELTAERFIPHPFSTQADERLYRTGDLVRYRTDGQLDYLGRIDHQVKLRGFRIELGEIESVLRSHADVQDAFVIVQTTQPGSQLLTAYIVPHAQAPSVEDLQQLVVDRLPQYMVPAAFIVLAALPLTPNGKVDRKALPIPDTHQVIRQTEFVAPRNTTEETLAQVWAELLGLETIGVMDNFFELGGHSLLALQVIARIQKLFQVQVQLQPLFEQPTIAQLADLILTEQMLQTDDDILAQLLAEVEALPEEDA